MKKLRQALIYVASSPVDEPLYDELLRHLSLLCRTQDVEIWCDRKVVPGREQDAEIAAHLERATLILLLVSPDLWDVPQVWEQVFDPAMARHGAGESVVVPIRLRPADWQGAPFAKLEPLPKGNKAVSELEQDRAFADLVNEIRDILEGLGTLNEDSYGGVVAGPLTPTTQRTSELAIVAANDQMLKLADALSRELDKRLDDLRELYREGRQVAALEGIRELCRHASWRSLQSALRAKILRTEAISEHGVSFVSPKNVKQLRRLSICSNRCF